MNLKQPRIILPILLFVSILAYGMDDKTRQDTTDRTITDTRTMSNTIRITIGTHLFSATLADNATATALLRQLPLTLSMKELNGNEKYGQLPGDLPTRAASPGTIQTGDLLLYGSNTLVVFYETFRTSYSYTKIGHIDNPAGLVAALGTGNVQVTFEFE